MDEKFSVKIATGKLGIITPSLAALSAASGYFTFKGAALGAETFAQKGQATVFAIASSIAIFLLWWAVLHAVKDWEAFKDKVLGLVTVTICVCFIVGLSSTYNVAGIDRGRMLEHDVQEYIVYLSAQNDSGFQDTQYLESVAAELRQGIQRYERLAQDEIANGTISGTAGRGAVSEALFGIAVRLRELLSEVREFQTQASTLSDSARTRLERIRQIHHSSKPLAERIREIESESDALRNDLTRMNSDGLNEAIQRTLTSLHREVDLRANFSVNVETRARQEAALERVRDEVQETTATLTGFLRSANASGAVGELSAYKGISPTRAVIKYWPEILPQWAGGIALDATPFAIVILMLISMGARTKAEIIRDIILNTPVHVAVRGSAAGRFAATGKLDPRSYALLSQDAFGEYSDDAREGESK